MTSIAATRAGAIRWLVPVLLLVVAGAVRFAGLDEPERIYFDETYYVEDAADLLSQGVEEGFAVHPPVGKWLIAASMAVAGDNPWGWRSASALAGALTVLFVYLAGLRLFRHRGAAALAGLLVALDGLALSMGRIAMLDATLALWVVVAFWLLLVDRDLQWRGAPAAPPAAAVPPDTGTAPPGERPAAPPGERPAAPPGERPAAPPGERPAAPPSRPHWARWAAGAVLGLAIATKWSAVLALGAAGLLVLGSELAFRKRTTGRAATAWPRLFASVGLPLLLVPAAVYVLSYSGWFANYELTRPGVARCPDPGEPCPAPLPTRLADWAGEQQAIARFHFDLEADHPYQASALTWPVLSRPIAYYYESCTPEREAELIAEGEACVVDRGNVSHVLGMGNPALFWLALPAYLVLFWFGFRRRDWRALAISAFLLGQYVPWLAAARPVFFFYATPLVPFIALTLADAVWRASSVLTLRWLPVAVTAVTVAAFVFWYPLFAGLEIPQETWELRIWTSRWV